MEVVSLKWIALTSEGSVEETTESLSYLECALLGSVSQHSSELSRRRDEFLNVVTDSNEG